ncbi:hypothetical protein PoB_000858900 [Plakobranchus ocellatus]|uniref:Uncharacterized protein n=1 Tax=Plakobranchus ocellatus TaxID=259542 RepID=A0AAV3YIJ5_9GAST|nr:hypothetical protein PoB_000858900 [Plakobranchus ocellatus]
MNSFSFSLLFAHNPCGVDHSSKSSKISLIIGQDLDSEDSWRPDSKSDGDESFVIPPSPTNNKVPNISCSSIINASACTPPVMVNNAAPTVPVAPVINEASCAPLAQVDNTAPDTPTVQVVNTDACAPSVLTSIQPPMLTLLPTTMLMHHLQLLQQQMKLS